MALRLSEGLGFSERGKLTASICTGAILLPAPRYRKSSCGTPHLRRLPRTVHGALRLAAWSTRLRSWPRFLACAQAARLDRPSHWIIRTLTCLPEARRCIPLAASGGVIVGLNWPALTPALTEIRLFFPFGWLGVSSMHGGPLWNSRLGRVVAVQFTAIGALSASTAQADFVLPNVRAEAGPTAKRQARVVENAPAHCAGLVF